MSARARPAEAAALNAGVLRYAADPQAKGALAADSQPTGRAALPTVGLHAIDDPTAFVELENAYRRIRDAAGTGELLVQSFSDEREHNIHVGKGATKEEFVKFRTERDATLAVPKLIIPSLQVNMRAGEMPRDKDGNMVLKVPVNGL